MKQITVTVTNEVGIHARPASLLTKIVQKYESEIEVYKNGDEEKKHQPRSILSLMAMGAKKGDKLIFTANGHDEEAALAEIKAFIESGCNE